MPSSVSRQEKLFLSHFAADRPGFLLSWLELILKARGPGTARSSSKYTQAAAPPAPTTKQGWALLRKVGHLGSWPTTWPLSFFCPSLKRQVGLGLEIPWRKFGTLGIWERLRKGAPDREAGGQPHSNVNLLCDLRWVKAPLWTSTSV